MSHDDQDDDGTPAVLHHLEQVVARWEASGDTVPPVWRERLRKLLGRLRQPAGVALAETAAAVPLAPLILGHSQAIQDVLATVRTVGPRGSNVLIEGESGTGKELVAKAIHASGPRAAGRFVAVDCGSVSDTLLESELFGHKRGSFTGATLDRIGLVEEADGGTLFLDEIANASGAFQTRLLRVLQEREIRRVGENNVRKVDLRVIAATSGLLPHLLETGQFRQDLFYRLNVVSFRLPALRRRREDIPDLVEHFLSLHSCRHGLAPRRFSIAALEVLLRYPWPGNVRELANVVERSVLMAPSSCITPADLPGDLLDALMTLAEPGPSGSRRKSGEQQLIERALLQASGDKTRAARLIGWHRTKLYRRLRRYGIANDFGRDRPPTSPSENDGSL